MIPYFQPGHERMFYAPSAGAEHMGRWAGWGPAGPMLAMPYGRHPMAHPGMIMAPPHGYGQEYSAAAAAAANAAAAAAVAPDGQPVAAEKPEEGAAVASEPGTEPAVEEEGESGEDKEDAEDTAAEAKAESDATADSSGATAQQPQVFAPMAMPAAYAQMMAMPMYDQSAYTGFKPPGLPMHAAAYYGMYGPPPSASGGPQAW